MAEGVVDVVEGDVTPSVDVVSAQLVRFATVVSFPCRLVALPPALTPFDSASSWVKAASTPRVVVCPEFTPGHAYEEVSNAVEYPTLRYFGDSMVSNIASGFDGFFASTIVPSRL